MDQERHHLVDAELAKLRNRIAGIESVVAGGEMNDSDLDHFIKVLRSVNTSLNDPVDADAKAEEPEAEALTKAEKARLAKDEATADAYGRKQAEEEEEEHSAKRKKK
jgi:hypothetical protein